MYTECFQTNLVDILLVVFHGRKLIKIEHNTLASVIALKCYLTHCSLPQEVIRIAIETTHCSECSDIKHSLNYADLEAARHFIYCFLVIYYFIDNNL